MVSREKSSKRSFPECRTSQPRLWSKVVSISRRSWERQYDHPGRRSGGWSLGLLRIKMSVEQKPRWLGYTGDYVTYIPQTYRSNTKLQEVFGRFSDPKWGAFWNPIDYHVSLLDGHFPWLYVGRIWSMSTAPSSVSRHVRRGLFLMGGW